ncbi:MAG: diaminopimelate decarboxylase [candidate division NC10 bacterium]|nr:diaminopimelate decarboxylase [candidate division NC10 bacterium]
MHHFQYRDDVLHCEEVPLPTIALEVGTPFYCYSHATLTRHFRVFDEAFAPIPHLICFALKANSNLSILKLFGGMGGGADVVSGGELFRALRAGIPPDRIVYAGVGKSREEIAYALKSDILMFNVESSQELQVMSDVATNMGVTAKVALRINPDVDPRTHPYISTGLRKSKFGIDISQAVEAYEVARELPQVRVVGIHQHIGSQITEVGPFVDALAKIAELTRELRALGVEIRYLDVGGGLGITYKDEEPPVPRVFAEALIGVVKDLECTIVLEPGRVIAGNAGILVTRVLYTKRTPTKDFVVVDAGMNDLIRPSLYGSYHSIIPVHRVEGTPTLTADVVGPICESGDFLAKDRELPAVQPGDLLAVMSAGAYGFTMASNYNARPRLPEVLGKGDRYLVIRRRESYEDLIRGEDIPEDL